jgi:hypothetical protein
LWFVGILLLLYLTLRSQLARSNEPEPDWDLVALYGGTIDVAAAGRGGAMEDAGGCRDVAGLTAYAAGQPYAARPPGTARPPPRRSP